MLVRAHIKLISDFSDLYQSTIKRRQTHPVKISFDKKKKNHKIVTRLKWNVDYGQVIINYEKRRSSARSLARTHTHTHTLDSGIVIGFVIGLTVSRTEQN